MAGNRKLYKEAIVTFGHASQTAMAVKACASLIGEIQSHKLMRPCNVQQAIADMEIMCPQLRLIFPGVSDAKKKRLSRLQEQIQARKEVARENKQT